MVFTIGFLSIVSERFYSVDLISSRKAERFFDIWWESGRRNWNKFVQALLHHFEGDCVTAVARCNDTSTGICLLDIYGRL
jgi:hypothetical protein